jgi:hypothetical protein
VVAGGLGQYFVAHHAVWAIVIGVVYEALVAVGGFLAVIAREVSSRWQARLADRIDLFLQRKGLRFERRYREFVLSWLKVTDTKGLATVGEFTPEHDEVFVNVSLLPRPPHQIKPGLLPETAEDRADRRTLDYFLDRAAPVVLAVVGAPGSGKTTLLRHAARQAIRVRRSRRGRRNQVRDIPVLLFLRDHAAAIVAEPAVSVAALLRKTPGLPAEDEPAGWFEQQLREGRCLVLRDGLDEVARLEDRVKVSAWAQAQVRHYPDSSYVISSRPRGYRAAPVERADIVQVCGFTTSQVEDFVRGWYRAAERHGTGAGPEAEALAAQGAADLLERLGRAPALYDLAVNPLLLTMIVNVHRYRGALPGSRADLYSEICQVMLWRRQEAKQLPLQMSGDKKVAILGGLAYVMMGRRVSDLSLADVLAEVQPGLRRVSPGVTPEVFLADASSNGLLVEREAGQYAFAHKTFQDYLAATHIREHGLVSVLASAVSDDWWAETTLLYTARSNADPVIRACLDDGTAPALAVALDCAGQDSEIDPDLRDRLDATVASAASPDSSPEDRRLFAAILLRRHVRQRVRTSAGSQICLWPVPAGLYRLFLADTMTPGPDVPLDEAGIATGMRGSDADAFVRWASDISGAEQAYRLPAAADLDEVAVQQPIPALPSGHPPAVWARAGMRAAGIRPVLWLAPGAPDPRNVSKADLVSVITQDAKRAAPALSGILLLRARVLTYTLHRALDHARDLGHARDLDLARDLACALDLALDHARDHAADHVLDARALALADSLTQARDRDLTRSPARDLANARQLLQASDRELARARARTSELTMDRDQALRYEGELTQARARVGALDRDLAQARAQAMDPVQVRSLAAARAQANLRARKLIRDRNRALARARVRDREIAQARTRERQLTQARNLAREQVQVRAVVLDLAQARDRDHILTLVRDLDRACTAARARGLGYALDLDSALASSPAADLAGDPASDGGPDLARDVARDSGLSKACGSESGQDSVLDLTIAISQAAGRHPLWRAVSEPVLSTIDVAFGPLLGQIFSMRFTGYPALAGASPARRQAIWTAALTKAFTVAAGGSPAGHIAADPATLETTLQQSVTSLARTLDKQASGPRASSRPAIIAERLPQIAGSFLTRAEQPAAGKAAASRLAALCLASEADGMDRTDIGDLFRQVAAGITLLERRAAGQWPAFEVIMLAVEQPTFPYRAQ